MKANEFVRRFGLSSLEIAKTLPKFNRYKYVIFYADEIDFSNELHAGRKSYMFEVAEVKRLVESHELVEECGGLNKAKERVALEEKLPSPNVFYVLVVSSAIADVESCL